MSSGLKVRRGVAIERTYDNAFSIVAREVGSPADGELLLGVETAGLCGTDIQIVKGMRSEVATVLGHEACCTVLGVGRRWVGRYAVGDRVAINPTSYSDPKFLLGHSVDGMWASHFMVSEHAVELGQVVPLHSSLSPVIAVLVEPLACAIYSWSILRTSHPERVVILGDGVVGRLVAWLATRDLGSSAVLLAGRGDLRDEGRLARVLRGMQGRSAIAIATPRDSTAECVNLTLEHAGPESMIDIIGGIEPGLNGTLQQASLVRGKNVCGQPHDPNVLSLELGEQGSYRQLYVTGHRGVSPDHLHQAVEILLRNGGKFEGLITHIVSPEKAVDALKQIVSTGVRQLDGLRILKLVIDFREEG